MPVNITTNKYLSRLFLYIALVAVGTLSITPVTVLAYSQGAYYGQGYYYAQGYYYGQGYYQSYYQPAYQTTITVSTGVKGGVAVTGRITKGSGTFVIDHPLDPKNKLLYHSFVESPDVKNIYDGIATLDKNGEATVPLPAYFDALNKDVRYQLKPIGAPMPNLHINEEEHDNQFGIGGGAAGGKVSWQITGTRRDPYILANPIIVEAEKGPDQIVGKSEYVCENCYQLPSFRSLGGNLISSFNNLFKSLSR